MAKKICPRRNKTIDFPKDCQGCASLNTGSKTPYCTYGESEKKTSKKSCCHC